MRSQPIPTQLNDLFTDVLVVSPENKDVLAYNASSGKWTSAPSSYTHNQSSSSTLWTVTHNLGKFPSVTVVDSAGTWFVGDVSYTNENELTISFRYAFSGKAYCN